MINRFTQYYSGNQLFQHSDKILLAVSGGIDSMVLWRLFEEAGLNYAVAHCNFHLRGDDSNQDEAFVRERADELGVKLYVTHFDTQEYAAAAGISIEMAARRLRYDWFEETRRDGNFRWIATAHHLDDMLETFFINLVRKTGIRGLTGIKPKSGYLVRPLLFASRNEIEAFAQSREIEYRTDITNEDVVYQRNFIRHRIIPELEKLNPAFRNNLAETMENLRQAEEFNDYETARQIRKISDPQNSDEITVTSLLKQAFPDQLLFAWMTRYGFNPSIIREVFSHLEGEPGRQFFSRTHRLVIDRNKLIVTPIPENNEEIFYLEHSDTWLGHPIQMTITRHDASAFRINSDPRTACLDEDKLEYPLTLRRWSPGEYFQPLGMHGFKKISDFYIDQKLSIPEKENTWILYSGGKVVWIMGYRIDNRFKITKETKKVVQLTLDTQ